MARKKIFLAPLLCFFFNDTATTEIYTLSLHDALPISRRVAGWQGLAGNHRSSSSSGQLDRKSTRLNSSHANISYAVFCLKKIQTTPSYTHTQTTSTPHRTPPSPPTPT